MSPTDFQGTHPCLQGNTKAMATVTAIIDGTGSMGKCMQYKLVLLQSLLPLAGFPLGNSMLIALPPPAPKAQSLPWQTFVMNFFLLKSSA